MPIESIFFFVSLAGLTLMVGLKWLSLASGTEGVVTRSLSQFDEPISRMLLKASAQFKRALLLTYKHASMFLHNVHHVFAAYMHNMVRAAERQVRNWREFARERRVETASTSGFLKDMTDYKNQLKQENHSL